MTKPLYTLLITTSLLLLTLSLFAQSHIQLRLAEGNFTAVIDQLAPQKSSLNQSQTYYLAIAYQQNGYPKQAINCLENYSSSLTGQQQDLLCRCYVTSGNYSKALPICEEKYIQNPMHVGNLMRYIEINNSYKAYEKNISLLTKYVSIDSLNYNINLQLAETYQNAQYYESAISTYKLILRQYPNNQKIALKLAKLYYNQKQYVECHDLCVPFIDRLERNKNFLLLAGLANFRNGSNHNVLVMYNRLEARGDSSFLTKKHLGIAYYRLENFNKALQHLHNAMNYKDDDPEVAFFLGASLGQSNRPLRGKPFLELAQELIKPSPSLMEKTNLKLALIHFDTGNFEEAVNYYKEAHKYAPDNPQYIYRQASIYDYSIKDPKKAENLYNAFLKALPEELDPKKGNELYAIKLKEVVSNRLTILKEEDFFKNGI